MIEDKGSDEDLIQLGDDEDDEAKPSTSEKKPQILNLDKGISPEYKSFLEDNGLPPPSKIFNEGLDPN